MKINTTANNDTRFLCGGKCDSEVTPDGHVSLPMDCEKLSDAATPPTKATASDITLTTVRVIQ